MTELDTRLNGIEAKVKIVRYDPSHLEKEIQNVKNVVEKYASNQISSFRDTAMKLLGNVNKASSLNADILSYFVASIGPLLTAVTFKGERKARNDFKFGLNLYRGFIASTQSTERIFQTLYRLQDLKKITSGRIITGSVGSVEDMKAVAVSIAAFIKVANLFNVETCSITDNQASEYYGNGITIRFEDRYTISSYAKYIQGQANRVQIIRSNRRNVYILGPNGVGKSSWGNLISGENTFEVGIGDHTTMIPQSCDMESAFGFRLWDTPGMFDGSEDQGLMQDYMNHVINVNGYFSGILFVFHSCYPANEGTAKILQYAIDLFGSRVLDNFIVIINDFGNPNINIYKATYSEMLYRFGYVEDGSNVIVSSALATPNESNPIVRNRLCSFSDGLVFKHLKAYNDVIDSHGDLKTAVRNLYFHGREELKSLLRRGHIETIRWCDSGPRKNISVPRNVLKFRQHSRNYFLRRLGLGNNKIIEERTVLLKGSSHFTTLIRAQLNQEYTIGEVNIFVRHILGNERYMLIHTPSSEHDYELRDATDLSDEDIRDVLVSHVLQ